MWKVDAPLFEELAEKCGSKYLAVNYLARCARRLASYHDVSLIESELLTWALTGNKPKLDLTRYKRTDDIEILNIRDCLSYIEDDEVKEEVIRLYRRSILHHHLIYEQSGRLGPYRSSRVNILLRMIWSDFIFTGGL